MKIRHQIIGIAALLGLTLTLTQVEGGTIKFTSTTPPVKTDSNGGQYIILSESAAASPGVSFKPTVVSPSGTSNGMSITSWSWSFMNGSPTTSTSETPTVFYGSAAWGQENSVTLSVLHPNSDSTLPACTPLSSIVSSIDVVVAEINGSAAGSSGTSGSGSAMPDLWYFRNGSGDNSHPVKMTATIKGPKASQVSSNISWSIKGQTDTVHFDNGSDTISNSKSLSQVIHAVGFSSVASNLTVQAIIGGATITSPQFTAHAPTSVTHAFAGPTYPVYGPGGSATIINGSIVVTLGPFIGWERDDNITVDDQLGQAVAGVIAIEHFNPYVWTSNASNNWNLGGSNNNYGDHFTTGNDGIFQDHFGISDIGHNLSPSLVMPGSSGSGTPVAHSTQTYYIGGSGTNGSQAPPTGYMKFSSLIEFDRGDAHR